jgi:tetratricopeptide (TPR) repeat protein
MRAGHQPERKPLAEWLCRFAAVAVVAVLLACSSPEQRAQAHLERGRELLDEHRRVEAALEFKAALQFDPTSVEANNRLAEIELRLGNPAAARAYIDEAFRLDPLDTVATLHLASALQSDHPDHAEKLVEAAIERHPENPLGYIGRSNIALVRGRMREAVAAARRAMEVAPNDPEPDWNYGYVMQAMIREGQLKGEADEEILFTGGLNAFERYIAKGGKAPWNAQVEEARIMAAWTGKAREASAQFRIAVEHALEKGPREDQLTAVVRAASFARSAGNDDLYEWCLETLVALEPANFRSWRELADLELRRREDPEPVWKRFIEQQPNEPRPHIEYARFMISQWKLDEALAYLESKADEGIDPPMLLGAVSSTQIAAGRLPDANETVKRLEGAHPGHPRTVLERAQLDMRRGEIRAAVRNLRSLAERVSDPDALLLLARAEEVSGRQDEALAALDRAIASSPFFDYETRRMKARLLAARGEWGASMRTLITIQERMPLSKEEEVLLARCYYETGQKEAGRKLLEDVVAGPRPPPEAAIEYARREGTDPDPERAARARSALEAVLRMQPENWDGVRELTRMDMTADRKTEALARLDRVVQRKPAEVPAAIRLLRAQVAAENGREAGTLEDARAAFEAQPRLRGALELVVALHVRRGETDEAVKVVEEAQRVGALDDDRQLLLGQLYRLQGRKAEAVAIFETTLNGEAQNPTLFYHLGVELRSLDRSELAEQAFEKALAISQSFPEAQDARRALEGARSSGAS